MGTEVHCKSSFEGYYSMRDANEDSNSSNWPLFYADKGLTNGHYYNGYIPRTVVDANLECDKDALRQKMLEHEEIFKNQVYELHRLYRRQRDMMEEVKKNECHKHRISIDTSSSSSLMPSQKPYEESQKWKMPNFPLVNSCTGPSIFGADISNSPQSCSKAKNNNNISRDCEITEDRPSKVRKRLFNLELPPDDNIDHEHEEVQCKQASEESSYKRTSPGQCFRGSNGLADLNEPVNVDDLMDHGSVDGIGPSAKPKGLPFEKAQSGMFNPLLLEGKCNGRDWLSNTHETGNLRSKMNFTPGTYPNSCASTSYPFMNPSDLVNSWGKSNGSLTHKLTPFQKQPFSLSSPQTHTVIGDKWRMNGSYTPNGYHYGLSSGSRDPCARFPSSGFDHRNSNTLHDRSQKIFKGSNFIDLTDTTKGIDLNNGNNSSRKQDQPVLPWLQPKQDFCKNDSHCNDHGKKGGFLGSNGKIFGFPVFGNSNDSSSLVSTSASLNHARENGKIKTETGNRGFDINIAWDDPANKLIDMDDCNLEKKLDTEIDKVKNHFDLNSCLTEVEDVLISESVKSASDKLKKRTVEIDLEAPAVPEIDEEAAAIDDELKKIDECDDESLTKVAAEAIVAMTGMSRQQDEVAVHSDDHDGLLWFAEVIETAGPVSNELDEYEALILQQELTKEEDYMPTPLALDFHEPDEAGPSSGPTRPRRGQTRRGRPRRDFQKDVLPGLVSLSRHEVTEDLQTFGGLMRATGYSWNIGPTRRNGTRGRRKSMVAVVEPPSPPSSATLPPLSVVVGLEERSLTGWGKTTRRPRRQRSAAGTPVAVPPLT